MSKKIAFATMVLVLAVASTPAFAISNQALQQGTKETRQLLRLMDTDQNGEVSKAEFMRFMEAEFDRLDVDHSGALSVRELSRFPFHYAPGRVGGTTHR
jgi:Ca2+-binding EF-hand superfamily protein